MIRTGLALLLLLLLTGCGSGGPKEDPILRLSAEESLAQGKALMEAKKYLRAREYLVHAFEVEPNSATGREGLLLAADTLYLAGGSENFLQAESKYKDFQNRFPTSDKAAYVQFQIANSLAKRMRKPDRDQSISRQALGAFETLLRLYPTSEYVEPAQEQIRIVRENLADSEFQKGLFNLRLKLPTAAVARFEGLLEEFPEYSQIDRVLFHLGQAHKRAKAPEKAREVWKRLREEHPDSKYVEKIPAAED